MISTMGTSSVQIGTVNLTLSAKLLRNVRY
jgi:hypothetical protein